MFWRMAGLSTVSPVETILDKENFTLEELLDEDEIIQECKALNGRLISFLQERAQIEQLVRYIVEEAPEDAEKTRTFKFPFIACEIFTCEVDTILKVLVEDEKLMDMLFSFLEPEHSHGTLLAGYFSKVVVCLLLRKTVPLMNYIREHGDIIRKLVDLIGITSIMEVLIRLIGADEHLYSNYADVMQWLEETDVLEMIVDKFSSSDLPEAHANAAEALSAITRYAPPGIIAKISSPSFVGRLFSHALEDSRPNSVLVNSLSVCISLLDPKRLTSGAYYTYNRQMMQASKITVNPETVDGMLKSLDDLLKLLEFTSEDQVLLTTYGRLHPPFGKHRLKIVEFISVLVAVSSEAAEKELIRLGALKRIIDLFFEYPFNNFLHHHVEQIVVSCLESKNSQFVEHILQDCNLISKFLQAEKDNVLASAPDKPTVTAEGKMPPRVGNIGHITRIANKLVQLGDNNIDIQSHLQENSEWVDWHANVLQKRNAMQNVLQWACGRPTALQDRTKDSDDEDYQDRDYDVAALANNLSQAFRYGIYSNDDNEETHGSIERDDEDVYFDDESAEVVISSLRLGDDQESGSLFTNSNWFAFEDDNTVNERVASAAASPSSKLEEIIADEKNIIDGTNDLVGTAASELSREKPSSDDSSVDFFQDSQQSNTEVEKPPEWVEWRGSSDLGGISDPTSDSGLTADDRIHPLSLPNGGPQVGSDMLVDEKSPSSVDSSLSDADKSEYVIKRKDGESQESLDSMAGSIPSTVLESGAEKPSSHIHNADLNIDVEKSSVVATEGSGGLEDRVEFS